MHGIGQLGLPFMHCCRPGGTSDRRYFGDCRNSYVMFYIHMSGGLLLNSKWKYLLCENVPG